MPPSSPPPTDEKSPRPYFNRELSWLAFNRRVLEQAQNAANPVLERLKFLAIVSSNLDEFYEIRVSGYMQQMESGLTATGFDGLGPREQLRRIHDVVSSLVNDQYACWHEQLLPELKANGIIFGNVEELTANERKWTENYFREQIYPVLTPLAIDPAHPFPRIVNKTMNILVALKNPGRRQAEPLMAILPVPRILPRIVWIDPHSGGDQKYLFLNDIIRLGARKLFPGFSIISSHAFRITRNSDLYIDEEEADNLLEKIEDELHKRQRGAAVRLEIEDGVDEAFLQRFLRYIELHQENVFRINGPINLMRLMNVYGLIDRPDLKDPVYTPSIPSELQDPENLFAAISRKDHLLHHPFESFTPVVDFIKEAARDPQVFGIKQTLYRTSGDSPIIQALIEAAQSGNQVTVLVELKARFDEANNIQWAKRLEENGVHVVYGMLGHKIHCKCCLVVRRENQGMRYYAHLGTGNYNPSTAKLYTDLSLFTSRPEITSEIAALFNSLTGFGRQPVFRELAVAPFDLHEKIQKWIDREILNAKDGQPAHIIVKVNSLVDHETIDHLYLASQAGVKIDLIIRGICCLVPGIKGVSENITVRSVVGRYLEHSRICYFLNAGQDPLLLLGSADWMPRNFYRRVEAVFPIVDPDLRERIMQEILAAYFKDNTNARILQPNGAYLPITGKKPFSSQNYLMERATAEKAASTQPKIPPRP